MLYGTTLAERQELSLTLLFIMEVLTIFIIAPLIDMSGDHCRWVMDVVFAVMAFVSVFIVANGLWRWLAIFSFVLCLFGFGYSQLLHESERSEIIFVISGLIFSANVIGIVAHKVFDEGHVTLHRIRGAIVIYLNITLLFATLDTLLATLVPGAYTNLPQDLNRTIGAMVYFSLTTITTIGYGDILPVHAFARSLATLEAVIGQFYVGILIATLVGLHVSHRQSKDRSLKKP